MNFDLRHANELDRRTRDLCEHSAINAILECHGLRLAESHEQQHYVWLKLPNWKNRRVVFVKRIYDREGSLAGDSGLDTA